MRILFVLVFISMAFSACDNSEISSNSESFEGGKLVFQNGEIPLNPETIEMVCYFEEGEDWVVSTQLNEAAAKDLFRLTSENIEGEMSLVKGDYNYFTAIIREPLSGQLPIQLVILSGEAKNKEGISSLFGFPQIRNCNDQG